MSHFLVTVLTDENTTVEELLEPFGLNSKVTNKEILMDKERIITNEYFKIMDIIAEYRKCRDIQGVIKKERDIITNQIKKLEELLNAKDEEVYQYAIQWYPKELITPEGGLYKPYNPYAKWSSYKIGCEHIKLLVVENPNKRGSYIHVSSAKIKDIQWNMLKYGAMVDEACIMPDGTWYNTKEGIGIQVYKNDKNEVTLKECHIGKRIIPNNPEWTANIVECYI